MCASCFTRWISRCSGHGGDWRGPTPSSRTDGIDVPIHRLKKSPLAKLGIDLYRRSQFSSGLDLACHLEPGGPSARSSRHRRTQERQDSGRHRTLANSLPLPGGHGLQRLQLPGIFGAVGAILPPAGSHTHPGQRLLPQGFGSLELVPLQPPMAGGSSTTAVFAGVQSHRAVVATRAPDGNSQPLLCEPRRTRDHTDSRLWRDAVPPRTHPFVSASFLLTHHVPLFMRGCIVRAAVALNRLREVLYGDPPTPLGFSLSLEITPELAGNQQK